MKLFNFKKKIRSGQNSNISKLRSPYLIKPEIRNKKLLGIFKKRAFFKNSKFKGQTKQTNDGHSIRLKAPIQMATGKKILAIILSLGLISFTIYSLFFSNYFLIKQYQVTESDTVINNNLLINKILDSTLNLNIILLDDSYVANEIDKYSPEIKRVTIKKVFPGTLIVNLEKYPTAANLLNISKGIQKKFLVDSQGLITEANNENPNLPYLKIETSSFLEPGKYFLDDKTRSSERLTYALQSINLFEEKFGIRILNALIKVKEREVDLYTEKGYFVMIDMEKDLNSQIDKLKRALSKLDIYKEPLQYIDLRISGTENEKVIYKRK